MSFRADVERLRAWMLTASKDSCRSAEWESEYPDWPSVWSSAISFALGRSVSSWSRSERDDFLYVLARDHEDEQIANGIGQVEETLVAVASAALQFGDKDAKWQVASELGGIHRLRGEAINLLCLFAVDPDEYVRRRALLALGSLRAPMAEEFAEVAWQSGLEYQRVAALEVLSQISSSKLDDYCRRAQSDSREFVRAAAIRVGSPDKGLHG